MNISNNHLNEVSEYLKLPDLIEGIAKPMSIGYLYGPSGKGKSFITLYLAYCIATGKDWRTGAKINTPRKVLYIAAEGELDFCLRRCILEDYYNESAPNLYILPKNLQVTEENIEELESAIKQSMGSAALVVIDTLSQTNPLDESNEALAQYLRHLAPLKDSGATVLIIHHTGIDESRSRGGTALPSNTDFRMRVDGDMPYITLSVEKVKAGPKPEPQQFELISHQSNNQKLEDYQGLMASSLVANPYIPIEFFEDEPSTEDIFNNLVLALDNHELTGRDSIINFIRQQGFTLQSKNATYTKFATLIKQYASDGRHYYKPDAIKESVAKARKK